MGKTRKGTPSRPSPPAKAAARDHEAGHSDDDATTPAKGASAAKLAVVDVSAASGAAATVTATVDAAWSIDAVTRAAEAVLGVSGGADGLEDSDDAAARREAASSMPLCYVGLHPLSAGNFARAAAAGWTEHRSFDDMTHVVRTPCGHWLCAACAADALTRAEPTESGTISINCPSCDTPITATLSGDDVAPRDGGLPVRPERAAVERLVSTWPRLSAKTNDAVAEAASVAQFVSAMLRRLVGDDAADAAAADGDDAPSLSASTAGGKAALCGICEEAPEAAHCRECGFGLCADCRTTVHAKGKFKSHTVIELDDPTVAPRSQSGKRASQSSTRAKAGAKKASAAAQQRKSAMCADHPDYPMELYCHRCAACVCLRCHYSGAHKGHDTTPLVDIHGALAADLTANAQHLGATEHIVANVVEQLQAASAEVATGAAAARESVQIAFAAAQAVLDAAKDDVNRRLAEWESSRRSAVTADLAEARATQLTLALAAVGLRAALVDSSTQAVTQLLERREALGKRAKAIARVSAFAEGALAALRADAKDGTAPAAAAASAFVDRCRTLLADQGVGGLRLFRYPVVGNVDTLISALRGAADEAVTRLQANSGAPTLLHWSDAPDTRLAQRLAGRPPSAPTRSPQQAAKQTGAKRARIADNVLSPAGAGGGAIISTLGPSVTSATSMAGAVKGMAITGTSHAPGAAMDRRISDFRSIGSLLDLHDRSPQRGVPAANDRDGDDDDDGYLTAPRAPPAVSPPRHSTRGAATAAAAVPSPELIFNFATQEPTLGGPRGADQAHRLQMLASQWAAPPPRDDGNALQQQPLKQNRTEQLQYAGGGQQQAPAPPGRSLDFGPAAALRRARQRPLQQQGADPADSADGGRQQKAKPTSGFQVKI
jgi:hypothetical protein